MIDNRRRLVVVAASARGLVASARRGGFAVTAVDGFGDTDTRRLADTCHPITMAEQGFDRAALVRVLSRYRGAALVYGGGLEWTPDVLTVVDGDLELLGNSPGTLALVTDARRWFDELERLDIPYPDTTRAIPDRDGCWLRKRADACGGAHVHEWRRGECAAGTGYFQRRVAGAVYSVVFLADGKSFRIVGWNRLFDADRRGDFRYHGAVNRADALAAGHRAVVREWIARLVAALRLVGVNGIDLVVSRDGPLLLDLNVRPPATLTLYDAEFPRGLIYAHVQACRGTLAPVPVRFAARAQRVVYTPRAVTIPAGFRWPAWCSDIPGSGARIARDAPLCTVCVDTDAPRAEERSALLARRLLAQLAHAGSPAALAS